MIKMIERQHNVLEILHMVATLREKQHQFLCCSMIILHLLIRTRSMVGHRTQGRLLWHFLINLSKSRWSHLNHQRGDLQLARQGKLVLLVASILTIMKVVHHTIHKASTVTLDHHCMKTFKKQAAFHQWDLLHLRWVCTNLHLKETWWHHSFLLKWVFLSQSQNLVWIIRYLWIFLHHSLLIYRTT